MRGKVIFFLLFGLEKNYQEKKITFYQTFFPLFGLEKINKAKKNISCKIKMWSQSCPLLANANETPQNNTKNREDIQFDNVSNFLIPTQISTSNSLVLLQFKSLQESIEIYNFKSNYP